MVKTGGSATTSVCGCRSAGLVWPGAGLGFEELFHLVEVEEFCHFCGGLDAEGFVSSCVEQEAGDGEVVAEGGADERGLASFVEAVEVGSFVDEELDEVDVLVVGSQDEEGVALAIGEVDGDALVKQGFEGYGFIVPGQVKDGVEELDLLFAEAGLCFCHTFTFSESGGFLQACGDCEWGGRPYLDWALSVVGVTCMAEWAELFPVTKGCVRWFWLLVIVMVLRILRPCWLPGLRMILWP